MNPTHQRSALLAAGLAASLGVGLASCFVSIDESKIVDGQQSLADAGDQDADASVGADADASTSEASSEAGPHVDASDASTDAPEAAETSWPEAAADGEAGDGDAGDGEAPDADWIDAPLVECVTDFDCPPIGCNLRSCDNNVCVTAGVMHEDVGQFELPAALSCNQGYNRTCVVAARNYLVALTWGGFVAFNLRDPLNPRQEPIPDIGLSGYSYLVRSGDRLWAIQDSGNTTPVAWLDVPLDGVSPFSAPDSASLVLPPVNARLAAPNDGLLLYHTDGIPMGYFARYAPGMPTSLPTFAANGAAELEVVASSANRALLHARVDTGGIPTTFQHRFSLQSDVTSSSSTNSGPYVETTLNNASPTYGFFAQSRKGAVAWVIARHDGTQWADVRAYWLLSGSTASIESSSVVIETFTTVPPGTPEGPLAFISDDTIAAAVISGGSSPSPSLDIVQKTGTTAPKLLKRIPTSPLSPGALSVAGDNGYAYVVTGTTVRVFAPSCNP